MSNVKRAWVCVTDGCHESGEGDDSDKVAEKHGKAFKHSTMSWAEPVQTSEQEGKR